MSRIVLVTPRDGAPSDVIDVLALLAAEVRTLPLGLEALDALTGDDAAPDVIILDARDDIAGARRLCTLLAQHPVLLLVRPADVALLNPDWGLADFVVDPPSAPELDARLRLLCGPAPQRSSSGPLQVDESAYTATLDGRPLDLTYTEFELLKFLAAHPGRVHTREVLLSEVWGYDYYGGTRTVDVHVRRLRAKFGNEYEGLIETVRNVGYRFQPPR